MGALKFIGRGSAFNSKEGNTSAYIKQGDSMLLIDCGENIFTRIMEQNLLDGIKKIYIIVTHFHPDHVGSLGTLIFYCYYIKGIKANIIYENIIDLENLLQIQGVSGSIYDIKKCNEVNELEEINIKEITSRKMEHVGELTCFGYTISFIGGKTIFFAGDTNIINTDLIEGLGNNYYEELYVDTCLADYPNNTHLSLRKLSELIPKMYRNKVFCMHLDCSELIERARIEGFNIVELG